MSKMEYMPVDCLQVPKVLFQIEKYKNLSNTAKILYSLFLDRLKFAVQNGWVDHNGDLFVIYPKSEMKKDLNTTRYGVDQAVQELVKAGKLMRIIPNNGKANHFYISDIYENEKEEKSMMTLDTIMANMPLVEREIIMDKMVKASRDILETIADMGYIDEYETSLTAMEERGYQDELGEMDIDQIQADGYEFGIAYIKNKIPMAKKAAVCSYSVEGRALIHTNLSMNSSVLSGLRNQPSMGRSTELTDSRISLFSAQRGKCALSGELFENAADIVCWLKTPAELGGKERYRNMILFHNRFLPLLQECPKNELKEIADTLKATKELMLKVNSLRQQAGLSAIEN